MEKVRIEHDDQPDEVVDKLGVLLARIGYDLKEVASGDGYVEYALERRGGDAWIS